MGAIFSPVYGVAVYLFLLATFLYAIGFVGNVVIPKTIDSGTAVPLAKALIIDLALLGLFAIATTGYLLIGIWFEERDMIAQFGERYRLYRERVGMLFPRLGKGRRQGPAGQ